jgi:hypothetical protein
VHISPIPRDALESLADLELHEALGTLGYEDNQYALSTSLRVLAETESAETREKLKKTLEKGVFSEKNLRNQHDGGSSVGGGGDIRALIIKNQVLAEILKENRKVSMDFLTNYPLINFEAIYSDQMDYVSLQYAYRSHAALANVGSMNRVPFSKDGTQELFTVFVPVAYWSKGAKQRKILMKELKRKVTGLFPVSDKPKMRTFKICQGSQKVTVPASRDQEVVNIQAVRAGYKTGCDRAAEFASSFTTPGLPDGVLVPEPGSFYFDCSFVKGAARRDETVRVSASTPRHAQMIDVKLTPEIRLMAIPIFAGSRLESILLRLEKGDEVIEKKEKTITSPNDTTTSIIFQGEKIVFGCVRR